MDLRLFGRRHFVQLAHAAIVLRHGLLHQHMLTLLNAQGRQRLVALAVLVAGAYVDNVQILALNHGDGIRGRLRHAEFRRTLLRQLLVLIADADEIAQAAAHPAGDMRTGRLSSGSDNTNAQFFLFHNSTTCSDKLKPDTVEYILG